VRVDRLNVTAFGRLSDRELRFGPGLTLVTGSNESGKSTTHAALRAGLFGLTSGGRRKQEETLAIERHRPWADSRYGATLELCDEHGRRLRLEWDFDRSRFTLRDAATGDDLTAAHGSGTDTQALARALYGVGRDVYLRVGCVDQAELNRIGEPDSVRHTIENVMTHAPADKSAATAVAALKGFRAETVGLNRAPTRPLPRAEAEAALLRDRLDAAMAGRADVEREAAGRDAALAGATGAAATLHRLESIRDHLRADELGRRLAEAERLATAEADAARLLEADAQSNGFTPVADMPALRGRLSDLAAEQSERAGVAAADTVLAAELAGRCRELEARVEALDPDRGAAERAPAVEAAAAAAAGSQHRGGLVGVAAGIVIAIAGAVMGMSAVIGLGAVVAAAAGIWAATARRGGGSRELDRLLAGAGPVGERLTAFRTSVERDHALAGTERELAATRLQAADVRGRMAGTLQLEAELTGLRDRLATALRECDIDPADLDEGLRSYDRMHAAAGVRTEATRTRTQAAEELRRLLGDDSIEAARTRLESLQGRLNGHAELAAGRDPDAVEQELRQARIALDAASAESAHRTAAVAERLRTLPDVAGLRERLDAADERVERLRHVDCVLRLAETELAEAAAETYRDFAPHLNASLETGISRLTGGRYTHAVVDQKLNVRVEAPETGSIVDLGTLSTGTQKQAYLVQRLELVRLMCQATQPLPVLLDDPFAHFDRERLERSLAWLADAAAERQIIVFSTDPLVADLAPTGVVSISLPEL
jgi:uncharacterized protein YhaN